MFTQKLTGGGDLAKHLRALPDGLTKSIVVDALKAGAEPMRRRMAENAPHGPDAPHLADHIVVSLANRIGTVGGGKWEARDVDLFAVAVGPSKDFFYGLYWEYGWVNHPSAHPFARPAFDSTVQESLAIVGRGLWAGVRAKASGSFSPASLSGGGGLL